jgi:hypothetical protein
MFILALLAYLAFGLSLFIFLKVFSKNRARYNLKTVLFYWPLAFKALLDTLKVGR